MEDISFRNAFEMENAICHGRNNSKTLSFGKMSTSDFVGVKTKSSDFVLTSCHTWIMTLKLWHTLTSVFGLVLMFDMVAESFEWWDRMTWENEWVLRVFTCINSSIHLSGRTGDDVMTPHSGLFLRIQAKVWPHFNEMMFIFGWTLFYWRAWKWLWVSSRVPTEQRKFYSSEWNGECFVNACDVSTPNSSGFELEFQSVWRNREKLCRVYLAKSGNIKRADRKSVV